MTNPFTLWNAAKDAAEPFYTRAIVLGYNVGVNLAAALGATPEQATAHVTFWVQRFDLPNDQAPTFDTTDEVSAHLDRIEKLPVYCLELEGNPRVDTAPNVEGTETIITDTQTGARFAVRTQDLEAITRLCVHAESQPTIGDWEPAG